MNRMLIEKVGNKFYGHDTLNSKYEPQIPASAEREYVRVTNAYMGILKKELEKQLPELKKAYKRERDAEVYPNRRNDSATDLQIAITNVFNKIKNAIIAKITGFGLRHKLEALAHMNRKLTIKEWKKAVRATLGIDIREDYYLGDFYVEQLQKWVDENVSLISTIPEETLDKMRDIVYDGFTHGKTTTRMVKEIQKVYGVSRRRAELIARDQTAKLNGKIQQAQQQDAGIQEYVWSSTGDERVRKSHKALNGKKFSWNEPPIVDERTGRRCHPGEDYECRCIARPVFNKNSLVLPLVDGDKGVIEKSIEPKNPIKQKIAAQNSSKKVSNESKKTVTYTNKQLNDMSLQKLRKIATEVATEYYSSGKSGISFGSTPPSVAAAMLAQRGNKTSLIKDIRSMQKKLNGGL